MFFLFIFYHKPTSLYKFRWLYIQSSVKESAANMHMHVVHSLLNSTNLCIHNCCKILVPHIAQLAATELSDLLVA